MAFDYPDWLKTAFKQKYPRRYAIGAKRDDINHFISQITIKAAATTLKDIRVIEKSRTIIDINTKEHENRGNTLDEVEIKTMKRSSKERTKNYSITVDKRFAIKGVAPST